MNYGVICLYQKAVSSMSPSAYVTVRAKESKSHSVRQFFAGDKNIAA